MSKVKVTLFLGAGALVVTGYVFRDKLRKALSEGIEYVVGVLEEAQQKRYNDALKLHQHGVDHFLEHPETGEVRTRPDVG